MEYQKKPVKNNNRKKQAELSEPATAIFPPYAITGSQDIFRRSFYRPQRALPMRRG